MKLNLDILSENLSEIISLKTFGQSSDKLRLSRPLLYDEVTVFEADKIYIALTDSLPEQPHIIKGTVIIGIGNSLPKAFFSSKCGVILSDASKGLAFIFNEVQKIFDKYDAWENALKKIIHDKLDIKSLVDVSEKIFGNPIFILDDELKCLAFSSLSDTIPEFENEFVLNKVPSLKEFNEFKNNLKNDRKKKDVYFPNKTNENSFRTMCANLFQNQILCGVCCVNESVKPFRASDKELLRFLRSHVEIIYSQYQRILSSQKNSLKDLLVKALNNEPISNAELRKVKNRSRDEIDRYICVACKLADDSKTIPVEYACIQFVNLLPGSVAFMHQNILVFFINLRLVPKGSEDTMQIVDGFLKVISSKGGVSDEFCEIEKARLYFIEACVAIEIGSQYKPKKRLLFFKDYVKEYIVSQAVCQLSADLICAEGLKNLRYHDILHKTNYFQELRTYIKCKTNAVQTAKELCMHRSTFITHMERINELIKMDLDDPEDLFYIQLSYKIMEIEG